MIAKDNKVQDEFFLKNIVDPQWNLTRDEYKIVRIIFYSVAFVLAIIDILAFVFYFNLNERIKSMEHDDFTNILRRNLENNEKNQQNFTNQVTLIQKQKELIMRKKLEDMEDQHKYMHEFNQEQIRLLQFQPLEDSLNLFLRNPNEMNLMKTVLDSYQNLEEEMKTLNNMILPVNNFVEQQKNIDQLLQNYINDFQSFDQSLENNLRKTLDEFNNRDSIIMNQTILTIQKQILNVHE